MEKSKFSMISTFNNYVLVRKNLHLKVMIVFLSFYSNIFIAQINKDLLEKNDNILFGLKNHKPKTPRSLSVYTPRPELTYFINNKQYDYIFMQTINTKDISTYNVSTKTSIIDVKERNGELHFTTKAEYLPKTITLKSIKTKYAKDQSLPCLYMINGRIIQVSEMNNTLDEKNILEVASWIYNNVEDNFKMNIIEIFTKSEKNIKESQEMILK